MEKLLTEFGSLKTHVINLQGNLKSKEQTLEEIFALVRASQKEARETQKQKREVWFIELNVDCFPFPIPFVDLVIFRLQEFVTTITNCISNYLQDQDSLSCQMQTENDSLIKKTESVFEMANEYEKIDSFVNQHTACGNELQNCISDLNEPLSVIDDVTRMIISPE